MVITNDLGNIKVSKTGEIIFSRTYPLIIQILHVVAEGDRVHVFVKYTADNLDANGVNMFLVEDGLETVFIIFYDTQKMAAALGN